MQYSLLALSLVAGALAAPAPIPADTTSSASDPGVTNAIEMKDATEGFKDSISGLTDIVAGAVDGTAAIYAVTKSKIVKLQDNSVFYQPSNSTNIDQTTVSLGGVLFAQGINGGKGGAYVCNPGAHGLITQDGVENKPYFSGADLENAPMGPADIAMSADGKMLYFSGNDGKDDTTAGESGEIKFFSVDSEFKGLSSISKDDLKAADVHQTSGIEVSADGKALFFLSTQKEGGEVKQVKMIKADLGDDGTPTINTEYTADITGLLDTGMKLPSAKKAMPGQMRAKKDGQLHIALDGYGGVMQYKPATADDKDKSGLGMMFLTKSVQSVKGLTIGGDQGSTLYAMGPCVSDTSKTCIDSAGLADGPGVAFSNAGGSS